MPMKRTIAKFAIAAALFVAAAAPASATSICDLPSDTSFEVWFLQHFYC